MPSIEELLVRIDATTEGLRRELRKADSGIADFERKTQTRLHKVDDRFSRLGKTILTRFLPALGAVQLSRSMVANIQAAEKLDIRMRRLTNGTEDFRIEQKFLAQQAGELNENILTLTDGYARLLALEKSGVVSRQQSRELLIGLTNARAALNPEANMGQVLYGLSQGLSSGILRAEEFNQVVEPIPGLMASLDNAANVAAGGFRKMVVEGKVTSEMFGQTLVKALKEFDGAAADMSDTVSASFVRLENSYIELSRAAGEAGLVDVLAGLTNGLAEVVSVSGRAAQSVMVYNEAVGGMQKASFILGRAVAGAWNVVQFAIVGAVEMAVGSIHQLLLTARRALASLPVIGSNISTQTGMEDAVKALTQTRHKQAQDFLQTFQWGRKDPAIAAAEEAEKRYQALQAKMAAAGNSPSVDTSLSKEAEKERQAIEKVIDALRFRNEQVVRNAKEQDLYNQLRAAGVTIDSAHGQEIAKLVDKHYELQQAQEAAKEKTEGLKDAARDMGMTFSSAFEDAVLNGEKLRGVLGSLMQDMARVVMRKGATEPLTNLMGSITDGIFKEFDFGSLWPFANGGIMSGKGSVPLRKYASGGIANSPQLAMYGEGSRPEAYVPLPDGRSIPVTLKGQASGPSVHVSQQIHLDARGADESFIRRWPAMKEELIRETKMAVAAEADRGGGFSKTVGRRS